MEGCLRCAEEKDIDLLFEWANEAEVRKNSFSTAKISYEEHKKWFANLMKQADRRQYIYEYEGEPIGQVRLDIKGELAEIGYSITASKRGMGHGKNILRLLYNQVIIDFPNIRRLVGKVKSDNIASQKVFLDMGYTEAYKSFEIEIGKPIEQVLSVNCRGGYTVLNK